MNPIRRLIYLVLALYASLALFNPKKIYLDRFTHDMSFLEWALLQPFPSMYSSDITLRIVNGSEDELIYSNHHPLARILIGGKYALNISDSISYKLTVKYREHETVKKYMIICNDSLINVE